MAIKGKRKSQARGSQARRRPAAAPRPVVVARRTPWYRTTAAKVIGVAALALVAGLVWWSVDRAQERSAALELSQAALETYTRNVQGLLQQVRPAAQAMGEATAAARPNADGLEADVAAWTKSLQRAEREAGGIFAGPSTQAVHGLFSSSVGMYLSAAKTLGLAAEAGGAVRVNALARASEQHAAATNVWLGAVQVLDRERERAELDPSGLGAPSTPPAGAQTGLPAPPDAGAGGGG